jgi:DNA-binding transcriptional MocR family regulator
MQCSSLAHYVAPGFNLGWSNAGRWQPEVERVKSFTNIAGAMLPQLAMAEFLESGAFDKHLKQLRIALWQSVEAARQEMLRVFPEGFIRIACGQPVELLRPAIRAIGNRLSRRAPTGWQ